MDDIPKRLASDADAIEFAAKVPLMDGPAKSMERIAGILENVGDALDKLGDNLGQSSTEVKGFMSRE